MRYFLAALIALALLGCDTKTSGSSPEPSASVAPTVVDMHNSRNSLDWAGRYEGILPCVDCVGIHTQLTLESDGSFEMSVRRLGGAKTSAITEDGRFEWEPDGNMIVLDRAGGDQRFAVGEGRLALLEPEQERAFWGNQETLLVHTAFAGASSDQEPAAVLAAHRWTLSHAADSANEPIDALFPDVSERALVFNFSDARLQVQGGCNGLRGGFQIDAAGNLTVTGAMSTLMACEDSLMQADSALAALLAEPLELILIPGAQATLVLLTAAGDVLMLTGELTLEARFGAPTRVFLEVAAQTLPCAESPRGDGHCLQVREVYFDEQGLLTGTASDWQAFHAEIDGYQHESGIRNILRVNRFLPVPGADHRSGAIYVLDLTVQSERVAE